jgi:hypothetical protein
MVRQRGQVGIETLCSVAFGMSPVMNEPRRQSFRLWSAACFEDQQHNSRFDATIRQIPVSTAPGDRHG